MFLKCKLFKSFFLTGILFLTFMVVNGLDRSLQNKVFAASASNAAVANAVATYTETTYFIHQDNLGSVVAVTDDNGSNTVQKAYNSYGSVSSLQTAVCRDFPSSADCLLSSANSLVTERAYTGQITDSSTTLQYYNARYYDSNLARFISSDQVQGGNRYSYVGGNPISNSDPSGNIKIAEGDETGNKDNLEKYVFDGFFKSEIHPELSKYASKYDDFLNNVSEGINDSMTVEEKMDVMSRNMLEIMQANRQVKEDKMKSIWNRRENAMRKASLYDYLLNSRADRHRDQFQRLVSENAERIYESEKKAMVEQGDLDREEKAIFDQYDKVKEFISQVESGNSGCELAVVGLQFAYLKVLGVKTDIVGQLYSERPSEGPYHYLLSWKDESGQEWMIEPYSGEDKSVFTKSDFKKMQQYKDYFLQVFKTDGL